MYNHKKARAEHLRQSNTKKLWKSCYKLTQELEKNYTKIPTEKMSSFIGNYRGQYIGLKRQLTKSSRLISPEKQWINMFNTLERNLVKYPDRYQAKKKAQSAIRVFKVNCFRKM